MSDSLGQVHFAIGQVNSVLNLPDRQVIFLEGIQITEELQSVLLINFFFRLVEMTFGLVHATILDEIKWNSKPPFPPNQGCSCTKATTRHFPIFDLGGLRFSIYFVQDCRYSLPKWQAVKLTVFAPWLDKIITFSKHWRKEVTS